MTLEQLCAICRSAPPTRLGVYLAGLNSAMAAAGINTPVRVAAFTAQLAHESGEFRYSAELADGSAYENRRDLGNTQPGDGPRFKGRGWIQLTGRTNYQKAGAALGLDLVGQPDLAAVPDNASRIACWFWTQHGLNELADAGDFERITRRINGGLNGQAQRVAYYDRARSALEPR